MPELDEGRTPASFEMPKWQLDKLRERAKKEDRTVSQYLREAVDLWFKMKRIGADEETA
jgi:hypothetical protein